MKLMGKIFGINKDVLSGKNLLLIAYEGEIGGEVNDLIEKRLTIEIRPYRKKRSRNANKYMWELCTLIAERAGLTKNEVYREAIKEVGWYRDFVLEADVADTICTAWSLLGTGWVTEQVDYDEDGERVVIRGYYGSSTYDTRQMSRLIKWLEEEAKGLGITIITEREKSLLLDKWKGALPNGRKIYD